jgi:hypothetical protein
MNKFQMNNSLFKFKLDPGSKKYFCPGCGKKRFVRYRDMSNGELLPEEYGRCDREINCGYHLNPYRDKYGDGNNTNWTPPPPEPPKPPSYISPKILKASLREYDKNNFGSWLESFLDQSTVRGLFRKFRIGTSKHWPGATVFWQIDNKNRIRSGKIMLYNQTTGKRVKKPYNHITWTHKAMGLNDFNLQQCFFGLHQIANEPNKPISIVESEKTAIIASVYIPNMLWMAVGSLTNLSIERFKPLADKKVILWPDLNAYAKWSEKADQLRFAFPGTQILVSDFLELNADQKEKSEGFDIADYLIPIKQLKKRRTETLKSLINHQWKQEINPELWVINPLLPVVTAHDVEILCNTLNKKHGTNYTDKEYLNAFMPMAHELRIFKHQPINELTTIY